jgi:Fur family zinc uptake transcriptional regulator
MKTEETTRFAAGFPRPRHDHSRCVKTALHLAEEKSREQGLRLTAMRRRVLEILWQRHGAMGAYDILDVLAEDGDRPAPMAVYRALDFLIDAGLVHKLNSLNAFIGCAAPAEDHDAQFLICERCGTAAEIEGAPITKAVDQAAKSEGFDVRQRVVEISGVCPHCQPAGS